MSITLYLNFRLTISVYEIKVYSLERQKFERFLTNFKYCDILPKNVLFKEVSTILEFFQESCTWDKSC